MDQLFKKRQRRKFLGFAAFLSFVVIITGAPAIAQTLAITDHLFATMTTGHYEHIKLSNLQSQAKPVQVEEINLALPADVMTIMRSEQQVTVQTNGIRTLKTSTEQSGSTTQHLTLAAVVDKKTGWGGWKTPAEWAKHRLG